MEQIDVVIPWRTDNGWREQVFQWICSRYKALLPEANLIISDAGGEFSRGVSRNIGFEKVKSDIFMIADADTTFHRENIIEAIQTVAETGGWCLAYDTYYNLDEKSTKTLLKTLPGIKIKDESFSWEHKLTDFTGRVPISGLIVLPREAFKTCGGYDPRFEGWGYEDDAFALAMRSLWGPYSRVFRPCYHLWHPRGLDFAQPHIKENQLLHEKYLCAFFNADVMKKLVHHR